METLSRQPHAPRLDVGFWEFTGRQPVECSCGAGGGNSPPRGLLCVKTKWPCGCDLHVLLKPIPPCFPLPRATSHFTALHRAFPTEGGKGNRDAVCWAAWKLSLDVELEHCLKKKKNSLLLWLICSLCLSWRKTLCAPPECWEDEVAVIIFMQILLRSRDSLETLAASF